MPAVPDTLLNLPPPQSTTDWINNVDLSKVKDSMMLTALTFLLFGNALAEAVRTQTKVITDFSDKMVEANTLMAAINSVLAKPSMTDAVEAYLDVPPFATEADARAYIQRYIDAGGFTAVLQHLTPRQVGSTWQIYCFRAGATSINNNLQLSINNYSSLSQQAQLVMQQGNTRTQSAMDYVTAAIEKWGKLLQSFVDNMRK